MYVCMYVYIYICEERQNDKKHTVSTKMFLRVTLNLVLSTLHPFLSGAVMANRGLLASFRTEYFS